MKTNDMEAENFDKEFTVHSGAFVIVDAAVLDHIEHPLAKKAIHVPVKHADAVFRVVGEYDDTILRSLSVEPAYEESDPEKVAQSSHRPHTKEVGKGLEPGEKDKSDDHIASEGNRAHGVHPATSNKGESSPNKNLRQRTSRKENTKMSSRRGGKDYTRTLKPGSMIGRRQPQKRPSRRRRASRRHKGAHQPESARSTVINFIVEGMGNYVEQEILNQFEHKAMLSEALGMLLAMTMNGWEIKGDLITNGTHVLFAEDWNVEEGFLSDSEELSFDFDWIYDTKRALDNVILEEKQNNINILLETLDAR